MYNNIKITNKRGIILQNNSRPQPTQRSNKTHSPQNGGPKWSKHRVLLIANLLIVLLVILGISLLKSSNTMTVEASVVNVRTGPGITYKVEQQVAKGSKLIILKEQSKWYHVELNDGSSGWVASWLIENKQTTPATNIAATVNTKDTKLRETSDSKGAVVDKLAKGTAVTITLEQDGWSQVQVDYKVGWIQSDLLTLVKESATKTADATATTKEKTMYMREETTNIREQANVNSNIVATLDKGASVTVLATEGDWFKVRTTDNKEGYVANWVVNYQDNNNTLVTSIAEATIMLDPGHGGVDSGAATNDEKYYEKDLALSTCNFIKEALEKTGAQVVMTRTDDTFVDLVPRSDMSNQQKPDVFISIHYNSTDEANIATGTNTFFYHDTDQYLATLVADHLADLPIKDNGASYNNLSVTRENTQPALLVELGYLSNDKDASYIITDDYQKQAAKAITSALTHYFQ